MQKLKGVVLPSGHEVTLVYFTKPPEAKRSAIWWLQLRKMGFKPGMHSEAYNRELPKLVRTFASNLLSDVTITPDLVLVPASSSRQYQPYVDALLSSNPTLPLTHELFTKPQNFHAGDTGRTYEDVLAATSIDESRIPANSGLAKRIWIIDDIFNTGNTAAAMLTRLADRIPYSAEIILICPLYVPLHAGGDVA